MELQTFVNDLFGSESERFVYDEIPSDFELSEMYISAEEARIEAETMLSLLSIHNMNTDIISNESVSEWIDKEDDVPDNFFAKIGYLIIKIIKSVMKFFRGIFRWIKGLFIKESKEEKKKAKEREEKLSNIESSGVEVDTDDIVEEVLQDIDNMKGE